MERFKEATQAISLSRNTDAIERALQHLVALLTLPERAALESAVGYAIPTNATQVAAAAYDFTRSELKYEGDASQRTILAETAQLYIVAANRLAQLSAGASY